MLNTIIHGSPGPRPPLLIAHGLFGSARNWGVIAKRLAEDRQVIAVDMRNHGDSSFESTHGYADMAADLAEVLAEVPTAGPVPGPADVLGHSMGGKAAMMLALTQPALVRRLVVADIAPVSYDHSQQRYIAALRRVDLAHVTLRSEAASQLDGIEPGIVAFLMQSLDLKEKRWRLNLDVLERDMPDIVGFPQIEAEFAGPALFLSGALSDYVGPKHRSTIKALFPSARFARIPDAGHWLHAEKPREFTAAVRTFLDADFDAEG